ncbi:phasin family protein [Paraburkholderia bengalensis]|uniref:Phasin family protein n=1 Tax=Paraburkholderia bengalensis TaxID=2747562 RepID=A0ABU8INS0_9BURK
MSESVIALPDAAANRASERAAWIGAEINDLAELYIRTAERLAELNSRAMNTAIDEQRVVALEAAAARSPFGAWRLQTSYALANTAKAVAWWRHVNEIMLGAAAEAVNNAESRVNSNFMALSSAFEDAVSGVGSSILTGDPAHAVNGMNKAVQIVDTDGKVVAPPRSR